VSSTDSFLTILQPSAGLYKEKGSRFLSFAYPVNSEEAVKERLEELRKLHREAKHHCYAYILGINQSLYRSNDDGEPNHSAGDPILGQIRSRNLTNVLVVVIRYFGGTKLGIGGLVSAYKTAAADALGNAEISEDVVRIEIKLMFNYLLINRVLKLVKEYGFQIKAQSFDLECELVLWIRESLLAEAELHFTKIEGLRWIND
jgi:uncharacterized YigZ family protein